LKETLKDLPVEPWTGESPQLYDLTAMLLDDNVVLDDLADRVGFREIKVKGDKLLLNGESIRLRGYNRHEYHGHHGSALPLEVMANDLQLLADLGCNFVRTSHYPVDMRFLDLCDEMGFYVWEETNSTSVDIRHPKYREQIDACATTMVTWHFNHPSIIIWGTLNECGTMDKRQRPEHKRILDFIRALDSSRPVTFASNAWTKETCIDLPDIVSWNWYEGWYWGMPDTIEKGINELLEWQDKKSKGGKGKPVIISEFGASAIYGSRLRSREKWSEDFQADVLDESLRVYCNHPRICGVAIWQFADVRTTDGRSGDRMGKPCARNSKGTFTELRQPKLAYDKVKHRMEEAARKEKKRR
jgi:beta-glucuronidase